MDFSIAKWQFVVTVFLIKVPKRGSDSMLVEKKIAITVHICSILPQYDQTD